ncbi:hypothetical protein HFD88_003911 [Aspergillus terreus]|nr:hypothetical protein HFD88_003911 [Aspergillus terreus]
MLPGVHLLAFAFVGLTTVCPGTAKKLIVDTDFFSDVDDVGALLLACTLPGVDLLAVNINYPSTYSALAVSSVLGHYGHPHVPIGLAGPYSNTTYLDDFYYEHGEYASKVAYHWRSQSTLPWKDVSGTWDPTDLYRHVLSQQPDKSVTIASIGFLNNLSNLLNSSADEYSPLSGPELVAAKVGELVIMGGGYPSGHEFNFWGYDPAATRHVVNTWPGVMVFSGAELGENVYSGARFMVEAPSDDPTAAAYTCGYNNSRYSWDPLTVLYAVEGKDRSYETRVPPPELFLETATAKIWRTAVRSLDQLPDRFPDNVPSTGKGIGKYVFSDISAWTSGFFPGSLYALLERSIKYPSHFPLPGREHAGLYKQLRSLGQTWSDPLHGQAFRTDTHDMGFLILPALRRSWELTGNLTSLQSVITAAHSLASRYDSRVNAIRSWDSLVNKRHNITDQDTNFLIIIDSMCNLDLLYYAGYHTGNQTLIDIATTHAHTVLRNIVRDDYSSFHCCNIDPETNHIKFQETVQGYKDWSTWSRGQAWGIVGYTQTYQWTKDPVFLETARGLADYFVGRLAKATHTHPYVPLWDFDAPSVEGALHGQSPYYTKAMEIVSQTIDLSFADSGTVEIDDHDSPVFSPVGWETILMNATINNNEYASSRSNNTGLVYADYYFLQFGNLLLEMGLA